MTDNRAIDESGIHRVRIQTSPAPQEIECPGCGAAVEELITSEQIGGIRCPDVDCKARIDFVHTREKGPDDGTEQATLVTDGGSDTESPHDIVGVKKCRNCDYRVETTKSIYLEGEDRKERGNYGPGCCETPDVVFVREENDG